MNTTAVAKVNGRNFASRYASRLLPDQERCSWQKDYGLTVCNDAAAFDVITPKAGNADHGWTQGFCSFHAPKAVIRYEREIGVTSQVVAR